MRFLALVLPLVLMSFRRDDLDTRLDKFAGLIVTANDATAARLAKAVPSRAGKIVLRDRIEKAADALRSQSERDAVPDYFRSHFEEVNGALKLKKGEEEYRRRLVEEFAAGKADLERLRPVIREVADNMAESPEINLKLKKYLSSPALLETLYFGDLKQKSRPDLYVILKKLGEVFTLAEDGRYYIPESRQEVADKFTRLGKALMEATKTVSTQLGSACENLVTIDELHTRLKKAAGDPLFACVLLKKSIDNGSLDDLEPILQKLREAGDELNRKLPEIFQQTPKGKVLAEKTYDGVGKALDTYDKARGKVQLLREPGRQLASRLRDTDERTETFRKMLQSDAVLALLDVDVGGEEADPVKYVMAQIRKAVTKDADGKYRVIAGVADDLEREIKDPDRLTERENRGVKIVSMWGEKIEDKDLREIFTSRYGKFEVERTMKERLSVKNYDGLKAWVDAHFDKSGSGYALKPSAAAAIETILSEIEKLEKESKKNDLKD